MDYLIAILPRDSPFVIALRLTLLRVLFRLEKAGWALHDLHLALRVQRRVEAHDVVRAPYYWLPWRHKTAAVNVHHHLARRILVAIAARLRKMLLLHSEVGLSHL